MLYENPKTLHEGQPVNDQTVEGSAVTLAADAVWLWQKVQQEGQCLNPPMLWAWAVVDGCGQVVARQVVIDL